MNAPATGQVHLVIMGATGMVGGYALRYALDHPSVGVVTVIGRKKLNISHRKLKEVLHGDFADCSALAGVSRGSGLASCLNATTRWHRGLWPQAIFRCAAISPIKALYLSLPVQSEIQEIVR